MSGWCVYLIECADATYYCGITNNLEKRFDAHSQGKGAKYTRGRTPLKLIATKDNLSKSEALKLEIHIKKLKRHQKVAALTPVSL